MRKQIFTLSVIAIALILTACGIPGAPQLTEAEAIGVAKGYLITRIQREGGGGFLSEERTARYTDGKWIVNFGSLMFMVDDKTGAITSQ